MTRDGRPTDPLEVGELDPPGGHVEITLLGTGTSVGIPIIGCTCRVCQSDDPRDRRLRCAAHVRGNGLDLVIDTGPDFREQALGLGLSRLDAVLYTHHHFDHIAGIDDLRPFGFSNKAPIPCYCRRNTAEALSDRFDYIFGSERYPGVPALDLKPVNGPFTVRSRYGGDGALGITPIEAYHGPLALFGYRIGGFAYLTDTNDIPDASLELLADLDVLVLDALRDEPHPTHFHIEEACRVADRIGASATYFTHMTHSVLHEETNRSLPAGVQLAYDGLRVRTRAEVGVS